MNQQNPSEHLAKTAPVIRKSLVFQKMRLPIALSPMTLSPANRTTSKKIDASALNPRSNTGDWDDMHLKHSHPHQDHYQYQGHDQDHQAEHDHDVALNSSNLPLGTIEQRCLVQSNGQVFHYTYFHHEDAQRCILICPATGVKQRLYRRMACYLQQQGFTVVTWDWSGIGDNLQQDIQHDRHSMLDWAQQDLQELIVHLKAQQPTRELFAIGHSFGGQALGLAPAIDQIKAVVTVAAQSGYWKHWPLGQRYRYALLWYAFMPISTRLMDYFPAKLFGLGENLPKGVALQWAAWCRHPQYLADYAGHARMTQPMLALYMRDDSMAPQAAVMALHQHYSSCDIEYRELRPAQLGVACIGHMGFFRLTAAEKYWCEIAAFFGRHSAMSEFTSGIITSIRVQPGSE